MSSEFTQRQSGEDQRQAQQLSLQKSHPPAAGPGYQLERFLGSGAYGEVWVGTDQNTGRQVAVKFYLHSSGVDWSLLSREVEKLVFLSADRYVVQLLAVGWDGEPPYYVMEYVENGSLEDYLKTQSTLGAAEAVEIFREMVIGLMHAHNKGVLHCDLKPANIKIGETDDGQLRPYVLDFGIAR
ncbi:MAG: serine/threonine protein kinase, partial [Planctomycetaceae bacterium]|nr:serine/threonine protein kinase [Planctomycetaceae bacterium]